MTTSIKNNKNLEVIKNILGLEKKRYPIYESDTAFIYTPAIQSNESNRNREGIDISNENMQNIFNGNKLSLLIIRYFNDFLIIEGSKLKEVLRGVSKVGKWCFKVEKKNDVADLYLSDFGLVNHMEIYSLEGFMTYMNDTYGFEFNNLNLQSEIHEISNRNYLNTEKISEVSPTDLLNHIHSYISSKGFNYTQENIKNLYLSLRAKPFVIISGISGTGKTKIVQLFAESIGATEDNGQFKLVPVRPDWSDSSDLIGYEKLSGEYVDGHLTKMIKQANENPNRPHFLLLDEMNLARVEYYFSDVLSVMESRGFEDGELTSSTINPDREQEERVTLPGNLYVIGTVNMDETTHPFSKKVLDRANTLEFNDIDLMNLPNTALNVVQPIAIGNEALQSKYIHLIDLMNPETEALVNEVARILVEMNKILTPIHTQVGYRVRDEICFYMAYNAEDELLTTDEALDYCIMQKILPRITGAGNRLDTALKALQMLLGSTYPRSEKKIAEMIERLGEDGFTSFWIA